MGLMRVCCYAKVSMTVQDEPVGKRPLHCFRSPRWKQSRPGQRNASEPVRLVPGPDEPVPGSLGSVAHRRLPLDTP